jgi:hypothetical protein
MYSSGNVGKRIIRKSNTPEKYRPLRKSGGGPRARNNQHIDLFAKGVLDQLLDENALQIQDTNAKDDGDFDKRDEYESKLERFANSGEKSYNSDTKSVQGGGGFKD